MNLRILTAGESHGPALTAILDGMPAGILLDSSIIDLELARRQKGFGSGGRMGIEKDEVKLLGGVMGGATTGAPIALLVENVDHSNWKGKSVDAMASPRPGHADLVGALKYGHRDLRPSLERASARETAIRVAAGAVCKHFLSQFGIFIGGYVCAIGGVEAMLKEKDLRTRFRIAEKNDLRCPDPDSEKQMRASIEEAIYLKDTLGGIIEVFAVSLPVGLGSFTQWDRRLDARLAQAVMSVQAIKGVEIGSAFKNTELYGTQAQDEICLKGKWLKRLSNLAGGIEAGISNGEPLIIRVAMKPIASTLNPQTTINLATGEESVTNYERSDYCPVPRAVPVIEAMVAYVLSDALIEKLGGDTLAEMKTRFETLRQVRLEDLAIDNHPITWWE